MSFKRFVKAAVCASIVMALGLGASVPGRADLEAGQKMKELAGAEENGLAGAEENEFAWAEEDSADAGTREEDLGVLPTEGSYKIENSKDPLLVLDAQHTVPEGKKKAEPTGRVQLFEDLDVAQQRFSIESLAGDLYVIRCDATGELLTAGIDENGERVVTLRSQMEPSNPLSTGSETTESETTETETAPETGAEPDTETETDPTTETDPETTPLTDEELALTKASASQIWRINADGFGAWDIRTLDGRVMTAEDGADYDGAALTLRDRESMAEPAWNAFPSEPLQKGTVETLSTDPYTEMGRLHDLHIRVRFGTRYEEISVDEMRDHVVETEDHRFVVDEDFFAQKAAAMAEKYNTKGKPHLFTDSYGDSLMLTGGDFGWKLDEEATAENLKNASAPEGEAGLVFADAVWANRGRSFERSNDIGDSYVEVDLAGQKVWLYKNGRLLIETDCVSGTYGTERQTPGGVYSIYYKMSPATLTGPGYSSFVNYWMPFNGGIGLHDAPWRGSFGGNIYKYDGSHGCINLPYDAAQLMYRTVKKGYPVICYYK